MFIYSKECLSDLLQSINECVVTDILFPHSNKTIWGTPCQRIHNDNPIPHFIANITAHNLTSADISYKAIANSLFLLSQNFPPSSGATVLVTANPSTYATLKTLADLLSPGQSAMLCSGNAQEAYDMIIIAQMTLLKTKSLFLHFYDSRRIVEEYTNIDPLETGILSKLVPPELVTAYKNDGITDLLPNIYTTLSEAMDQFNVDTGRSYRLMEYSGHPEANIILVAMGTVSHLVEQTMEALSNQDKDLKVGMIRVRLHRPWSEKHFLELLPNSIQSIAVLEPVEDASVSWSPLFLDVVAACYQSGCEEVELHCGSYIADQDCVCPDNVVALISGLSSNQIPRQFSMDALKSQKEKVAVVPDSVDQCIFIGNENLALCYAKGLEKAQCYTVKKGHVPVTHIRSNATTDFPFLIEKTNIIVVPDVKWNQSSDVNYSIMEAIDILTEGGTFVTGVIDIETSLPNTIKQVLYSKKVQMVLIPDINSLFKEKQSLHDIIKQFTPVSVPESWKELQDKREHPFPSPARSIGLPLETPYLNVLNQVFGSRLEIANAMNSSSIWSPAIGHANAATPEFGYGYLVSKLQERSRFVDWVMDIIRDGELPNDAVRILSQWLLLVNNPRSNITKVNEASELVCVAFEALVNTPYNKIARPLLEQKEHLESKSNWLVGSDNWAEDLGLSGIHHVITSGDNINILIIDTTLYSKPVDREKRKKDIGLYAMNYGSVYVASVAIYSSYIGVLQALMEADAYPGPSIVLAYLPQLDNPVDMLKDTKVCVDNGSWPLYRWNPELGNMFKLDSQRIKHDLESFLNRENQLSLLTREDLDLSETLVSSIEANTKVRRKNLKRKARDDYAKLLSGLKQNNGPPLTILFGSDNGNSEGLAKRVAKTTKARGVPVTLMALDDYEDIQGLANESNLVIICSTAGQGEMPSNAREFWKALNNLIVGDVPMADLSVSILGLGDSHYWPRKEDAMFYNRPAKLFDAKFGILGASRLLPLGLCDDQDADGFETGYSTWFSELCKALKIREGPEEEEPPITDDQMKIDSNYLRGNIAQELVDRSTGTVSEDSQKLLKFHGIYSQDDRDLREERKNKGMERAYSFLIRVRTPGGVATPAQWLVMDQISDRYANKSLKLTTRQAFQLHGVLKKSLRITVKKINKALLSTLAACGDVNRNIMCTSITDIPEIRDQAQTLVKELVDLLAPKTTAYHEIWLDNSMVAGHAVQDFEPIYGPTYLPRKFKIVIAVPPDNDVDIYAHDLGFIAIVDSERKQIVGYNVLVGGGMGQTFGNKKTYPRPASVVGYIPADAAVSVAKAVVVIQRDHGDRTNRKHARFKYTVDDYGLDFIKKEIETRSGVVLEDPRPFSFRDNNDRYGWTQGNDNTWNFGMFIENGRVKDTSEILCKTGLRELAKFHKGEFRLTANQHLVIANVPEGDLEKTKALLAKYKLDNLAFSGMRKSAMACVALPTCGMAMAESERYLPHLITLLEETLEEAGLSHDSIVLRMTGCPNGCARPYLAEIALVGKAPETYNLYLGGSFTGDRLNKLYKESLQEHDILDILRPMIKAYAIERKTGEPFGDWVIRAGYVKETISGKDFHNI